MTTPSPSAPSTASISSNSSRWTKWRLRTQAAEHLNVLHQTVRGWSVLINEVNIVQKLWPISKGHLIPSEVMTMNQSQLKKTLLQAVSGNTVSANSVTRLFGVGKKLAQSARKARMDPVIQWRMSLRQASRSTKLSDETRNWVIDFYYQQDITRELPGKRDQIVVRGPDGAKSVVSKKILEVTLTEIWDLFYQRSGKKIPDIRGTIPIFAIIYRLRYDSTT